LRPRVKGFVENAVTLIQHEDMTIAIRIRPSLDQGIRGNGIGTGIRFILIIEGYRDLRLGAGYDGIRNPDGTSPVKAGAEVWMNPFGCSDGIDISGGVGVDRQVVDGRVPNIIRRKNGTALNGGSGLSQGGGEG
jgi:hypothetical protein